MNSAHKLKLLLARVVAYNFAFAAYFLWPDAVGVGVAAGIVVVMRFVGAKTLGDAEIKLDPRQKKTYFSAVCLSVVLWLVLLLSFLFVHSSPQAWTIGSVGVIVLVAVLLYSYSNTFGATCKGLTRRWSQPLASVRPSFL